MVDWSAVAVVFATFMGPVAAVQAQKWLERRREKENRKVGIFAALMATRSARVSMEHVRALNSLDLAFYGETARDGSPRRSKDDGEVLSAWREYFEHLNQAQAGFTPPENTSWIARADELFLNLLEKLAVATRFKFERQQLRSGQYSPRKHYDDEIQGEEGRRLLLEVLAGNRAIAIKAAPDRPAPT